MAHLHGHRRAVRQALQDLAASHPAAQLAATHPAHGAGTQPMAPLHGHRQAARLNLAVAPAETAPAGTRRTAPLHGLAPAVHLLAGSLWQLRRTLHLKLRLLERQRTHASLEVSLRPRRAAPRARAAVALAVRPAGILRKLNCRGVTGTFALGQEAQGCSL